MRLAPALGLPALVLLASGCAGPGAEQSVAEPGNCFTTADAAQLAERPSPLDSAVVSLGADEGAGEAKICYGSPSANGREIMGTLVPFGVPWRFGANEATSLRLTARATVGGREVGPGAYSVYVVPGADSWEVVLNRSVERWGIPIDAGVRGNDMTSLVVTPESLETPVEALTMEFEAVEGGADLLASWERTRIRIPIRPVRS